MKHTGSGRTESSPSHYPSLLLYNFDIDGAHVKHEHERALSASVVPTLQAGGSVSIVGLASRSGSMTHNDNLSLNRAKNVLKYLTKRIPAGFNVRVLSGIGKASGGVSGVGERKAQQEGYRDGTEDERFRSVLVFVSLGSTPPNVSGGVMPAGILLRDLPATPGVFGVLDTVGKILDTLGGVGSVVALIAASPLLDVGVTLLSAVAPPVGLIAVWISGNKLAERNGLMLGFSRALQTMSDAFADYDLKSKPETAWPVVPHPVPDFSVPENLLTVAMKSAREGERKGYEQAYSMVMQYEKSPLIFKRQGHTIKLSGRAYLFMLHYALGDDVKDKILAELQSRAR